MPDSMYKVKMKLCDEQIW